MAARQRFIHPDIWTDPSMGQLGAFERLLFIGCFSNADDEGRLLGSPAYLRATIFPYDDLTLDAVEAMRDKLIEKCKNIVLYVVDDLEYLAFLKWSKYQKPKYAKHSKFPAPEEAEIPESFPQNSGNDDGTMEKASVSRLGLDRVGFGLGLDRDVVVDDRARESNSVTDLNLVAAWEKQTGRPVNPVEAQKIQAYVGDDNLEPEVVAEAMTRAALQNKSTMAYVDGILKNWIAAGARTIVAVRALDASYEQSRQAKHDKNRPRAEPRGQDAVDAYLKTLTEVEQYDHNTS